MKCSILHATFGFTLAFALWSLNLLPGAEAGGNANDLAGRHSQEDTAIIERQLRGE